MNYGIQTFLDLSVNLSLSLALIYILNRWDQSDSLAARKKKYAVVYRPNVFQWSNFVTSYKRYSVFLYVLIVGVVLSGIYVENVSILSFGICLVAWKFISQHWPVTYVFDESGLHTWDPFMLYERKDTEEFYDWRAVREVIICPESKTLKLVLGLNDTSVHPIRNNQIDSLILLLKAVGVKHTVNVQGDKVESVKSKPEKKEVRKITFKY